MDAPLQAGESRSLIQESPEVQAAAAAAVAAAHAEWLRLFGRREPSGRIHKGGPMPTLGDPPKTVMELGAYPATPEGEQFRWDTIEWLHLNSPQSLIVDPFAVPSADEEQAIKDAVIAAIAAGGVVPGPGKSI